LSIGVNFLLKVVILKIRKSRKKKDEDGNLVVEEVKKKDSFWSKMADKIVYKTNGFGNFIKFVENFRKIGLNFFLFSSLQICESNRREPRHEVGGGDDWRVSGASREQRGGEGREEDGGKYRKVSVLFIKKNLNFDFIKVIPNT
jgi:hypothetical protein